MSMSLMISNPVDESESNFNVPISTEKVFHDYWMPIIEELDLKWALLGTINIDRDTGRNENDRITWLGNH